MKPNDKVMITGAALTTGATRAAFKAAINETTQQILRRDQWRVAFLNASEDPCLWAADYIAWAIGRKWEHGDETSYSKVAHLVESEFDIWRGGRTHYY